MSALFDPTTAHGQILIAVVAALIVAAVGFVIRLIIHSKGKECEPSRIPLQTVSGNHNIQIHGDHNHVQEGDTNEHTED